MKKNILFVVDEKRMGGVSVLLEDILNTINTDLFNIDILVLHNNGEMLTNIPKKINIIYGTKYFSAIDYTIKEVIKSHNLKLLFNKIRVVFDMKTGLIKKRIIKERSKILTKKYDVEIAFKDGFTAIFAACGNSKKKIHWLHYEYVKVNPNGKYDKLFKELLPKFNKIVAVSESVMNAFNDIYHLESITTVIYNLVDTNKIITKGKEKTDVKLNNQDLNFVSVGRLHPQKGYPRLIKVINDLNINHELPKNFKLKIYGNGPSYDELDRLITEYNLKDYVQLMGKVMNPYNHIKGSDMFIMPSIYEPFGLVIIEAMTLGVPVLATKNHATGKIINDKINGYITDNSESGLYDGLKYIFNNQNEITKYKNNLKTYTYDNQKIIKQIEGVLTNEK